MKFSNRELCIANGFKSNTSKERAVTALANGKCEGCEKDIAAHVDNVKWNRRFGVFHVACYGLAGQRTLGDAKSGGVEAAQVDKMIRDALASHTSNASDEAIAEIVKRVESRIRVARELHVTLKEKESKKATVVKIQHAHVMLERLIFIVGLRKHAYLYGPPGSGKSTLAMHAAKALKLTYGYISLNPQTPESRLIGYNDANGKFQGTVLYNLYKNGGVFCIDEMDNASAALLTTLNSLLENGFGAFPCGMVERHPDFVVVATGNTAGRGGNMQFPERRAFDAAFAERFAYLKVEYDEAMEREVARTKFTHADAWVDWVQAVRKFAVQHDAKLVVSPRATFGIAEFLAAPGSPFNITEVIDSVLFKGIEAERVNRIMSACPIPSAA